MPAERSVVYCVVALRIVQSWVGVMLQQVLDHPVRRQQPVLRVGLAGIGRGPSAVLGVSTQRGARSRICTQKKDSGGTLNTTTVKPY